MEKYINVSSYWGTARNEYITSSREKLAVILLGHGYTNMAPLLYYPLNIALESGYDALAVEYGFQRSCKEFKPDKESLVRLVDETKQAVGACLKERKYEKILFIGKSLGTFVQAHLKDEYSVYRQRHIFLTPLPECICAIKQTDCIVAVGTKDRIFKSEHIAEIAGLKNVNLAILEDADHRMETGNYKEDLRILTEVCGSIYRFINKQI